MAIARRPTTSALPKYHELPIDPRYPAASSWGLWGDDDVLGCLNLIDEEVRRRGLAAAGQGRIFRLDLPLTLPSPQFLGRHGFTHEVVWNPGRSGQDDTISEFNTQVSSQWDGLRHAHWPPGGFYNGLPDHAHGIGHFASPGIVSRGVLLDVAAYLDQQGRPLRHNEPDAITAEDLRNTIDMFAVDIQPGDVLMVRTGWMAWYQAASEAERIQVAESDRFSGLAASVAVAELLWNLHVAAVACDNPAVEPFPLGQGLSREERRALVNDPARVADFFLHYSLIALLGLPLGELWDLEAFADHARRTGNWHCLLVSAPLYMPGGVASPANVIAIQ